MTDNNQQQGNLKGMIEKIIDNGNLSPQDQTEINQQAKVGVLSTEDRSAIEMLREKIESGQIKVS